jgi:hypothetical protein
MPLGNWANPTDTRVQSRGNVLTGPDLIGRGNPNVRQVESFGVLPRQMEEYRQGLTSGTPTFHDNPLRTIIGQTVAEVIEDAAPTVIRESIVQSMQGVGNEHLEVLPLYYDESRRLIQGVATSTIIYDTDLMPISPEKTSPRFIGFRKSSVFMKLKRRAIGFEVPYDWLNTPEGRAEYMTKMQAVINDAGFTAKIAAMEGLLRAHTPTTMMARRYGKNQTMSLSKLNEQNQRFGMLQKSPEPQRSLLDMASDAAATMGAGAQYTHLFVTSKVLHQLRHDPRRSEYMHFGPGNRDLIDNPKSLQRMDGIKVVEEKRVNVHSIDGQDFQALEQPMNTGLWYLSSLHSAAQYPAGMAALNLYTLNLSSGNGVITCQAIAELVGAAACWDANTGVLDACYAELASGNNAKDTAEEFGIPTTPRNRHNGGASGRVYDPWLVSSQNGGTEIVHIVGNQDPEYLDFHSVKIIAKFAEEQLDKREWTDKDAAALEEAIRILKIYRNPENFHYTDSFVFVATKSDKNEFGTHDIPHPADVFAKVLQGPGEEEEYTPPPPRTPPPEGGVGLGAANTVDIPENEFEEEEEENADGVEEEEVVVKRVPLFGNAMYKFSGAEERMEVVHKDDLLRILVGLNESDKNKFSPGDAVFPGYGSMQHLRTIVKFSRTQGLKTWALYLNALAPTSGDTFRKQIKSLVAGFEAMEKFARTMQRMFSVHGNDDAANIMFREDVLPWWNRGDSADLNRVDAMIQNLILGISYPIGYMTYSKEEHKSMERAYEDRYGDIAMLFDGTIVTKENIGNIITFANLMLGVRELQDELVGHTYRQARNKVSIPLEDGNDLWISATKHFLDATEKDHASIRNEVRAIGLGYLLAYCLRSVGKGVTVNVDGMENFVNVAHKQALEHLNRANNVRMTGRGRAKVTTRTEETDVDKMTHVANTTLVLDRDFFLRYLSPANSHRIVLTPSDPESPGAQWLLQLYGNGYNDIRKGAEDVATKFARSEFNVDLTCMGRHSGSVFPPVSLSGRKRARDMSTAPPQQKKARYVGGPRVSGAGYHHDTPGMRNIPVYETEADMMEEDLMTGGVVSTGKGRAYGVNALFIVKANKYFQKRWDDVIQYTGSIIRRVCHWLVLTQRVHRDAFVNMIEQGIPAPMGVLAVNPYISFVMAHAVFAVAGCGYTYYTLPDAMSQRDGMHKIERVHLSLWIEAFVHKPEQVFVAEYVGFNGYTSGGSTRLIVTVAKDTMNEAEFIMTRNKQPVDFDPAAPGSENRRGDRFALHVGARVKFDDIPGALPLEGSYGREGAYRGDGSRILPYDTLNGPAYDSAVVANMKFKFNGVNKDGFMDDISEKDPRNQMRVRGFRKERIATSFNTLCHKGDQFLPDADGAYTVRIQTGDGILDKLTEGVVPLFHGNPGNFADLHAVGP